MGWAAIGTDDCYVPSNPADPRSCSSAGRTQPQQQWNASSTPSCIPAVPSLRFDANNSATLEFGQHTFDYGDGVTFTTYAYSQDGVAFWPGAGPTIRMTAGNLYRITLQNTLEFAAASTEENVFRDTQITNLHTHGLHISGESPADDVSQPVNGQQCADFEYDILAEHLGGSHWYHPHHHGSTFLHVSGGALGMIVVENARDNLPESLAAMPQRELVVAYVDPTAADAVRIDSIMSTTGELAAGWAVNGVFSGDLCVEKNEWMYVRVLMARAAAQPTQLRWGDGCEAHLLARDGVYRRAGPLETNSVDMPAASRADFAVRCSADTTLSIRRDVVANIVVSGDGEATDFAVTTQQWEDIVRPDYLSDFRDLTEDNTEHVVLTATSLNGVPYTAETPSMTINCGELQQWTVASSQAHPLHIHVNHFQLQSDCGRDFEPGEFYDTLSGTRAADTVELALYICSAVLAALLAVVGVVDAWRRSTRALKLLRYALPALLALSAVQTTLAGPNVACCAGNSTRQVWDSMCTLTEAEGLQFWAASVLILVVEVLAIAANHHLLSQLSGDDSAGDDDSKISVVPTVEPSSIELTMRPSSDKAEAEAEE
eukprot:PLAT11826.1.p1 GENE.PLAT11826.1~~PLAT11826.1.p1  ORF type:complete len:671 (+),score=279.11 PLAT11826.1:215-2014(+)